MNDILSFLFIVTFGGAGIALYVLIGFGVAFVVDYIVETWIDPCGTSCWQLWLMILFPFTGPLVLIYEILKRLFANRSTSTRKGDRHA